MKFYFAVKGTSLQDSEQRLAALSEAVMKTVDDIVEKRNKQQTAGSDIRRFLYASSESMRKIHAENKGIYRKELI